MTIPVSRPRLPPKVQNGEVPVREKRKKIWIDRFQTYLIIRIAVFFIFYQTLVWGMVFLERQILTIMNATPEKGIIAPGIFLFLLVLLVMVSFLFIYEAVKFAHRLVGPLYRFRKTIQAITAGEEIRLLTLREGDFLQEMKDEFNVMLQLLEQRGVVVLKSSEKKEQCKTLSV